MLSINRTGLRCWPYRQIHGQVSPVRRYEAQCGTGPRLRDHGRRRGVQVVDVMECILLGGQVQRIRVHPHISVQFVLSAGFADVVLRSLAL